MCRASRVVTYSVHDREGEGERQDRRKGKERKGKREKESRDSRKWVGDTVLKERRERKKREGKERVGKAWVDSKKRGLKIRYQSHLRARARDRVRASYGDDLSFDTRALVAVQEASNQPASSQSVSQSVSEPVCYLLSLISHSCHITMLTHYFNGQLFILSNTWRLPAC